MKACKRASVPVQCKRYANGRNWHLHWTENKHVAGPAVVQVKRNTSHVGTGALPNPVQVYTQSLETLLVVCMLQLSVTSRRSLGIPGDHATATIASLHRMAAFTNTRARQGPVSCEHLLNSCYPTWCSPDLTVPCLPYIGGRIYLAHKHIRQEGNRA